MLQVTIVCDCGLIGPVHSAGTDPEIIGATQSNGTVCEMRKTCLDCTAVAPACYWSLVKQSCNKSPTSANATNTTAGPSTTTIVGTEPTILMTEPTIVTTEPTMVTTEPTIVTTETGHQQKRRAAVENNSTDNLYNSTAWARLNIQDAKLCPAFTVNYTKAVSKDYMYQAVRVDIANDPAAGVLAKQLSQGRIDCSLSGKKFIGVATNGGRMILCNTTDTVLEYNRRMTVTNQPSTITYFSISMKGLPLEFNHLSDHYLTLNQIDDCRSKLSNAKCINCFWDDEVYRHYCRLCTQNEECTGPYEYCDIRYLGNITVANSVDNVVLRCPDARIESVDPLYAPWAGGTTVKITVTNHKVLQMNKVIVVTVAGHRCLLPTTSLDGTQISCMIAPTNSSKLNDGPVEVSYISDVTKSSLPVLTIRSDQTFYFVEPEIASIQPACGRLTGGTMITIRGNFLNAGNSVQAFVGDNGTCQITALSQNEVTCVTGPSKKPTNSTVRLEFDKYLKKHSVQPMLFEYTGEPVLDANQTFRGIATGGTRLPVRGQYFGCIEHPFIYVSYKGIQHTGTCNVVNDTYMECRSPTINRPAPYTVTELKFGFQADFDKTILKLVPPVGSPDYQLYPDPVYTDFEIDRTGRTVIINGLHLDQGYHISDDLSIRLQNSTVTCNVGVVESQRIMCRMPGPLRPLSSKGRGSGIGAGVGINGVGIGGGGRDWTDHDTIVVSFGDKLVYEVKRKMPLPYRSSPINLTMLFSGITIISLIITFVVAVVYCMKIALQASNQQTEMQSLCEQQHDNNSTAIAEDCRDTAGNYKT